MWLSILASLLLPKAVQGLRMPAEIVPDCLELCTQRSHGDIFAATMERLCGDTVKQRALLLCLLNSCSSQHYGPALAYTISSCSTLGHDTSPLYPVDIKRSKPIWRRTVDDGQLMSRWSSPNMDPFNAMACSAGPDGVITVTNTAEGADVTSMPNHANLPGGHRGPLNPELQSEIGQIVSEKGEAEATSCSTCSPTTAGTDSDTFAADPTQTSVAKGDVMTSAITASSSAAMESALGRQDDLSHSCESSSTSSKDTFVSASKCGCSVTTSSTPTPTSCFETPEAILSTETTSDCSTPTAALIESTPTSSSTLTISTTTPYAIVPTSSSCETPTGHVSNITVAATTAAHQSDMHIPTMDSPVPDLHFPKKPSQSSCSFSNSTAQVMGVTSGTTPASSAASSSACTTSPLSSPSPVTPECSTSEDLTESVKELVWTTTPTPTSSTHITTSMELPEYTTPSILPAYQPLTPLSIPEYGELPIYGSILSPANVAPTSSTKVTSMSHTTSLHSPTSTPVRSQTTQPQMYTDNEMKAMSISESVSSTSPTSSFSTSTAKHLGDAASFLSDQDGKTAEDGDSSSESTSKGKETSDETTLSLNAATVGDKGQPSELYVTIVAPDGRGVLQTSIMTIEEQSPWATHAPREIANDQIQDQHSNASLTEASSSVPHSTHKTNSLSAEVTTFAVSSSHRTSQSPLPHTVATATGSMQRNCNMFLLGWVVVGAMALLVR